MSTVTTTSHTTTFTLNLTPALSQPRARYPVTPRASKPFYLNDKTPYTPYTTSSYNPYLTAASPRTHRVPSRNQAPTFRSSSALLQTELSPPRKTCSPYISPSNPFSRRYAILSPSLTTPHERLRELSGWAEEEGIWGGVVKVVFWAAVVVFLSALFGFGGELEGQVVDVGMEGNGSTVQEGWTGTGVRNSWMSGGANEGIESIWKGVEVSGTQAWRFEKPLEGIWEGDRSARQW